MSTHLPGSIPVGPISRQQNQQLVDELSGRVDYTDLSVQIAPFVSRVDEPYDSDEYRKAIGPDGMRKLNAAREEILRLNGVDTKNGKATAPGSESVDPQTIRPEVLKAMTEFRGGFIPSAEGRSYLPEAHSFHQLPKAQQREMLRNAGLDPDRVSLKDTMALDTLALTRPHMSPISRAAQSMSRGGQAFSPTGPTGQGSDANAVTYTAPRPYSPEIDSPDRAYTNNTARAEMNKNARVFFRHDGTSATLINMLSEQAFGEFKITGKGVDGAVKKTFEECLTALDVESVGPAIISELLITGESLVRHSWDTTRGIFTHAAFIPTDDVRVFWSPRLPMDPIVDIPPDADIKGLMQVRDHPAVNSYLRDMPKELLAAVEANKYMTLNPRLTSFMTRRMHPYDVRGTSIYTRMWRVLMWEDALFSAAVATARRMAGPIKLWKLGNPQFFTPPERVADLKAAIANQEFDPAGHIFWDFAIAVDLIGANQQVLNPTTYYPLIEQIKLAAFGVAKAVLSGEVNYSASATSLTLFMQRLSALRNLVVRNYLMPKVFRMVAKANGFYLSRKKSSTDSAAMQSRQAWLMSRQGQLSKGRAKDRAEAEAAFAQDAESDSDLIVPDLVWARTLDPKIDSERINAMQQLSSIGLKFSRKTMFGSAGVDYEDEMSQLFVEGKQLAELARRDPIAASAVGFEMPGAGGGEGAAGGGGGGGAMIGGGAIPPPTLPGDAFGGLGDGGGGDPMGGDLGGADALPSDLGGGEVLPAVPASGVDVPDIAPAGASVDKTSKPTPGVGRRVTSTPSTDPASKDPTQLTKKVPGAAPTTAPTPAMLAQRYTATLERHGITSEEVAGLKRLFRSFDAADVDGFDTWNGWVKTTPAQVALNVQDSDTLWNAMESYLVELDYPAEVIVALEHTAKSNLPKSAEANAAFEAYRQKAAQVARQAQLVPSEYPVNSAFGQRLKNVFDRIPENTSAYLWSGTLAGGHKR